MNKYTNKEGKIFEVVKWDGEMNTALTFLGPKMGMHWAWATPESKDIKFFPIELSPVVKVGNYMVRDERMRITVYTATKFKKEFTKVVEE